MITFGGCDSTNLTPKILKLMTKEFPALSKKVIVGTGFRNGEEIEKQKDERTNLTYNADANMVKEIMIDSDIAISAAGQTLSELARIGAPTIALAVADNQLNNLEGWRKAGFIESVDVSDGSDSIAHLTGTIGLLSSGLVRKEKSLRGRNAIDGNGARRIVNEIVSMV